MIKYAHLSRYIKKSDVIHTTGILCLSHKEIGRECIDLKKRLIIFLV